MISRRIFAIHRLAWSPAGQRLAIAGFGRTARILDANTLRTLTVYRHITRTPEKISLGSAVWSPDGTRIATTSQGLVNVWDSNSGDLIFTCPQTSRFTHTLAWSPDGAFIAIGSWQERILICDAATGHLLFTHSGYSIPIAWSPDGRWIASGGISPVTIRSPLTRETRLAYPCQFIKYVVTLSWSPDSQQIAAGGNNPEAVEVLNATSGETQQLYRGHRSYLWSVDWSPRSRHIASASQYRTVQVWSADTGKRNNTYHGHTKSVSAVAWSPDGVRIASGGEDGTVQIWTPEIDAE
jgi:WD40 repeat protein